MSDEGFISVYTTYDKDNALAVISAMKAKGTRLIYRTTTETGSNDVLYEICVPEDEIDGAHAVIFSLKLN